jgi:uncharacterized protein (TIGR03084 family)
MDEILAALDEQQAELDGLINPVDDAAWLRPSRCDGWTVADVVLHLAQTNEMAVGSLTGTFDEVLLRMTDGLRASSDIDDGAGLMVEKERGAAPADVYARWRSGVDQMMAGYRAANPHDRVQWVAGLLSVHTLSTTRLAETWIHTNDVAFGLGVELPPPDRLRHGRHSRARRRRRAVLGRRPAGHGGRDKSKSRRPRRRGRPRTRAHLRLTATG